MKLRRGKLTNDELKSMVLDNINIKNKEIIKGGAISEDCSALKSDEIILVTTDPITAVCDNIGYLAIHVCANDISASGGEPFACLVTLLAHPEESVENIGKIMTELNNTANKLGIDIIGGHTEFTDAVNRTIVSVTMLGKTNKFISSYDFEVGDEIFVIGNIGIEGTGILLTTYKDKFLKLLGADEYAHGVEVSKNISVLKIGMSLSGLGVKLSMHDITEGGVFGAIAEMCEARGCRADICEAKIPVSDLTKLVCTSLGVNPYGLISSGSMICVSGEGDKIRTLLDGIGERYAVIGSIKEGKGVFVNAEKGIYEVFTKADELFNA